MRTPGSFSHRGIAVFRGGGNVGIYPDNGMRRASQLGIKTVLIPMYEWTPPNDKIPCYPDLFLCPSN